MERVGLGASDAELGSNGQPTEAVFLLIQIITSKIIFLIDSGLTYEQLQSPVMNFNLIRPTLTQLATLTTSDSLIYALLIVRIHFINLSAIDNHAVNIARSDLAELLAIKLLATSNPHQLLITLTTPFHPFQGIQLDLFPTTTLVDQQTIEALIQEGRHQSSNGLETAIYSKAKRFVQTPEVQDIIKGIYSGAVTYQPHGSNSLIRDDYKLKPVVEIYDFHSRPFLDQYRLKVPSIRSRLEFITFIIIMSLFVLTQTTRNLESISGVECLFMIWSLGFCLDELASMAENGPSAYFSGIYNILDALFCSIFIAFLALRIPAVMSQDLVKSKFAFDTLALSACFLFPRLSITLIRENVILLALSALIKEFLLFMMLAALTASGVLVSLYCLGQGTWDVGRLSWLMMKIWLGSTFLGFDAAQDFHPVYGPMLILFYAILSQTLLLTMLISVLSNTFATVQKNAETEIIWQKALRTIERVQSDALSSYVAPLNLVAFLILLPLRLLVSRRWFHKINAILTKTLNLPILVFIALETRLHIHATPSSFNEAHKAVWKGLQTLKWEGKVDLGQLFEYEIDPALLETLKGGSRTTEEALVAEEEVVTLSSGSGEEGGEVRRRKQLRAATMDSPLAKVFSVAQNVSKSILRPSMRGSSSKSTAAAVSAEETGAEVDIKTQDRLTLIENNLEMILLELRSARGDSNASRDDRKEASK